MEEFATASGEFWLTAIKEHRPSSFGKLLAQIEIFQEAREASWYRGIGDRSFVLIPSLSRTNPTRTPEELNKIERGIANTFAQRSPPFVQMDFSSEWRTLFFMQHYGIPTRLLDWSESPFVALYFALTSVRRDPMGEVLSDAALWLCDPISWNRTSLAHISFQGGILDENCEEIKAYSPSSDVEQRATTPIMIYGTHNSPRIVAQRGVFALFGKGIVSMEDTFINGSFPKGTLQKIVIERDRVDEMLRSLYRKGIAESTIYPDILGLSLEIKRSFGYL